ncbi:hypothetical protein LTR10_022693 [Elasticomyces elasticus]|uniref:Major facilitator superfamily (MFS) profile domain-containing protein n=1 Tax=Exophiala sideris TaxID=1016849 RepID=A0ABR0JLV0_9EURO|nr:hypothetical protein LTR10_022693 [Elasticomyces elasticus]KAK5036565.1 hypothetical protein LTS07_002292 [Exophiala sideris]KAK5066948.1 hypothetical protein LTR69_002296 [Exophiala sideris]KAK5185007.1 hypothetical protein LTR44_002853 [Eurotiomycetes sp. CCFEE 6388]
MEMKTPEGAAQSNPELEHIELSGHATQHEDHQQTRWQAVKANPKNVLWCLYGAWALICIGFDYDAGIIVLGVTEFRKDFGEPIAGGDYAINAAWQSAFSGGPSASLQLAATDVQMFFGGKLINGVALGFLLTSVLTWLSEISPLAIRAVMTGLCNLAFCLGPFVCTCIENSLSSRTDRWAYRGIFLAQLGFGFTAFIVAPFMPESPWWLAQPGKVDAAKRALQRLGHGQASAEKHLADIRITQEAAKHETEGASYLECFKGTNLRRTIIAMMPLSIQCLSGVPWIASYSTYYFELAGLSSKRAWDISGAFILVDRFGRRRLLLWGFGFLAALLMVTGGLGTMTTNHGAVLGTIALMSLYNFVFNCALGPVAYTVAAETPTGRLRTKTVSLAYISSSAISTMWLFVLPYIVNPNQGNLGAKTGFIFGAASVVCWVYLFFYQPETAGRNFEESDELFHKKVPARQFRKFKTDVELKGEMAVGEKLTATAD